MDCAPWCRPASARPPPLLYGCDETEQGLLQGSKEEEEGAGAGLAPAQELGMEHGGATYAAATAAAEIAEAEERQRDELEATYGPGLSQHDGSSGQLGVSQALQVYCVARYWPAPKSVSCH